MVMRIKEKKKKHGARMFILVKEEDFCGGGTDLAIAGPAAVDQAASLMGAMALGRDRDGAAPGHLLVVGGSTDRGR